MIMVCVNMIACRCLVSHNSMEKTLIGSENISVTPPPGICWPWSTSCSYFSASGRFQKIIEK